jgi:hypothetical protein
MHCENYFRYLVLTPFSTGVYVAPPGESHRHLCQKRRALLAPVDFAEPITTQLSGG